MYEKSDVKNNVKKEYLFPRPRPYGKIPSCTTSQDVQEEIRGHQQRKHKTFKQKSAAPAADGDGREETSGDGREETSRRSCDELDIAKFFRKESGM